MFKPGPNSRKSVELVTGKEVIVTRRTDMMLIWSVVWKSVLMHMAKVLSEIVNTRRNTQSRKVCECSKMATEFMGTDQRMTATQMMIMFSIRKRERYPIHLM